MSNINNYNDDYTLYEDIGSKKTFMYTVDYGSAEQALHSGQYSFPMSLLQYLSFQYALVARDAHAPGGVSALHFGRELTTD